MENDGPPRFLGSPHACVPCSTTPPGRQRTSQFVRSHVAFRCLQNVGSRYAVISGLNHTAHTLAVYASQCRLPEHHARLATGCWLGVTGRVAPLSSLRTTRQTSCLPIPCAQASPGAHRPDPIEPRHDRNRLSRSGRTSRPRRAWQLRSGCPIVCPFDLPSKSVLCFPSELIARIN